MRLFLLIAFVLGYVSGFSQGFSKTGTDDLYLYKGTVLYKDGNGFIANVQKNFNEISIMDKYGELFLRVVRKKESVKSLPDLAGMQTKTIETITRQVCQFQIDTNAYGKVKNYTINDRELNGTNLVYLIDQNDSLHTGEVFYFNQYGITTGSYEAEKYKMPILTVIKSFNFCDGAMNEEIKEEEEISIVETGDINFPYEVKVPEALKNKVYRKTSSYEGRPIADNYKTGNSQFFAIINEQTKDTSFILGSMHGTEAAFWNKKINQPELFQRLSSCRALYIEFFRQEIQQDEIIKEPTAIKAPYPHGKTLENYLTPEQNTFLHQQYDTCLKKNGIVYDDMVRKHPDRIYGLFLNTFLAERDVILELALGHSMGKHLTKKADIDFEFAALDNEKEAIEVQDIYKNYYTPEVLINKLKTMETYIKSIWLAYEDGDIEKCWKLLNSEFGQSFYNTVIAKRNENWLPRMMEGMKQEKCFFIVGAAHLGGPQGILNLLKEKGYTVLPLKWLN
jgi:uncharacterized protein YbaP (TraB family)